MIFKEKRIKFRFLKNSKKSLPFFPDISYFLRNRWDWETKNSRKIAETLDLKISVKNLIFSVKNFYFIGIQQNWEHDNFEKIWETSHLENSEKKSYFPWITPIFSEPSRFETSSILRKSEELRNWEMLVESHIYLSDKITNTTIFIDKTYFKN